MLYYLLNQCLIFSDDAVIRERVKQTKSESTPLALDHHADTESKEVIHPSPNSSTSGGSENTSLLRSLKSNTENESRQIVLQRRPAVRRHTTAEHRFVIECDTNILTILLSMANRMHLHHISLILFAIS